MSEIIPPMPSSVPPRIPNQGDLVAGTLLTLKKVDQDTKVPGFKPHPTEPIGTLFSGRLAADVQMEGPLALIGGAGEQGITLDSVIGISTMLGALRIKDVAGGIYEVTVLTAPAEKRAEAAPAAGITATDFNFERKAYLAKQRKEEQTPGGKPVFEFDGVMGPAIVKELFERAGLHEGDRVEWNLATSADPNPRPGVVGKDHLGNFVINDARGPQQPASILGFSGPEAYIRKVP